MNENGLRGSAGDISSARERVGERIHCLWSWASPE